MQIMSIVIPITVLVFAVIFHEVSHGFVAYKLGDPTAKMSGRLTLNPLPHIDPFWTIIMPVLFYMSGLPIIGGAKPVPVDSRYFKNPKKDMMLVGLAGPVSNILLAAIGLLLWKLTTLFPAMQSPGLAAIIVANTQINLMLAAFNLIPIPPLDGSRIVSGLLPTKWAYGYEKIEPYGFIIIMVLLYAGMIRFIYYPIQLFLTFILKFLR